MMDGINLSGSRCDIHQFAFHTIQTSTYAPVKLQQDEINLGVPIECGDSTKATPRNLFLYCFNILACPGLLFTRRDRLSMWVMAKSKPQRDSKSVRFFSITRSAPLRRKTGCSWNVESTKHNGGVVVRSTI